MAVTSLWHVKGRMKDLIDYVENPEKTVPNEDMQDFLDVFSYVKNPLKTNEGGYVSAINCLKETSLQQMILTKKQYQKTGGYIAWHGYQSFKPDEATPEQCHEIGLKLAKEMWSDKYQIIVATHLDKGDLHNHFCFNSVSYLDGSRDLQHMMKYLADKVYEIDFSGEHWKMKLPQYKHFTRLDTLDERLTPDFIRSCLGGTSRYGNYKARISYSPHMPEQYKNAWKPHQKTTGILALYYY